MSFRVECSPSFCGPDCTTRLQNNPRLATCQADGSITCTDNRFDPSPLVACTDCLYNLDNTTGCSTCIQTNYDPATNCTACLSGYDIDQSCSTCINTNYDPDTCSLCLKPDRFTDTDCSVCVLPGGDPATLCQTCLATKFDSNTNCSQCIGNRDLSSSCSTCLPGYDSISDCAVCLSGRNISTRCTTCLPGFTGSSCEPGECCTILHRSSVLINVWIKVLLCEDTMYFKGEKSMVLIIILSATRFNSDIHTCTYMYNRLFTRCGTGGWYRWRGGWSFIAYHSSNGRAPHSTYSPYQKEW